MKRLEAKRMDKEIKLTTSTSTLR